MNFSDKIADMISRLGTEAGAAGDTAQVRLCERAVNDRTGLTEDREAIEECLDAIQDVDTESVLAQLFGETVDLTVRFDDDEEASRGLACVYGHRIALSPFVRHGRISPFSAKGRQIGGRDAVNVLREIAILKNAYLDAEDNAYGPSWADSDTVHVVADSHGEEQGSIFRRATGELAIAVNSDEALVLS